MSATHAHNAPETAPRNTPFDWRTASIAGASILAAAGVIALAQSYYSSIPQIPDLDEMASMATQRLTDHFQATGKVSSDVSSTIRGNVFDGSDCLASVTSTDVSAVGDGMTYTSGTTAQDLLGFGYGAMKQATRAVSVVGTSLGSVAHRLWGSADHPEEDTPYSMACNALDSTMQWTTFLADKCIKKPLDEVLGDWTYSQKRRRQVARTYFASY